MVTIPAGPQTSCSVEFKGSEQTIIKTCSDPNCPYKKNK